MMFQFCCVIAEARWSRDSLYLSYKAVVSGVCVCYTRQQCRETVSILTGSSVGRLCVLVEDLLEIRVRGIQDEGKRFGVEEEEVFRK